MQPDIKGETNDEMVKEKDLLGFVTEDEMIPGSLGRYAYQIRRD